MDFALSDEQELFRKTVRSWVEKECPKSYSRELEQREFEYPFELWDKFSDAGFHGLGIGEEFGGSGGDAITLAIMARELARSLAGLTWVWGLSFAGSSSVGVYGSAEQKRRFLPELGAGRIRLGLAITEPGGGTDVLGALRTRARRADGGWVITGQKMWATAAHVADYVLLLARTEETAKKSDGVTLFLVPRKSPGFEARQIPKLGMRALGSCEVFLDDVFVPNDLVLGNPGAGWGALTGTLNSERILNSAVCLGIIDGALEDAIEYLNTREAFGKKIGQFQSLQHHVADMVMMQKQAELVTMNAAWLHSRGQSCGVAATMAKVITSEYAGKVSDLAIQCLGGMGYSMETDPQRYWRDSRVYRLAPIASEMARSFLAESQGLPRSF